MEHENGEVNAETPENSRNNEDNLSLGEWTILDRISHDNVGKNTSFEKESMIRSRKRADAEVAREAIQVLDTSSLSSETAEISEKENDKTSTVDGKNKDSGRRTTVTDHDDIQHTIPDSPVNNIISPVGTLPNIIIACLLAALLGFGIGRIVREDEIQLTADKVDFGYTESLAYKQHEDRPTKQIAAPDIDLQIIKVRKQPEKISERISHDEQYMNIDKSDTLKYDSSFREILEKVRFTYDILCSAINNNSYKSRGSNEYISVCDEPLPIMNLIESIDVVQRLATDIGHIENGSDEWFMSNMDSKLKNISTSLFNDLSKAIKSSVTKVSRKFDKMKHKLDHRLCYIRNTFRDDERIQRIFSNYRLSEDSCSLRKFAYEIEMEPIEYELGRTKQLTKQDTRYVEPKIKVEETDKERSNVRADDKDRTIGNPREFERNRSYKQGKTHKSQKKLPKGDFASDKATMKLQKSGKKKVYKRIVIPSIIEENFDNDKNTEQTCHTDSCAKRRDDNGKNDPHSKHENWQFQRSDRQADWREQRNVLNKDDSFSKNGKRARTRSSGRDK